MTHCTLGTPGRGRHSGSNREARSVYESTVGILRDSLGASSSNIFEHTYVYMEGRGVNLHHPHCLTFVTATQNGWDFMELLGIVSHSSELRKIPQEHRIVLKHICLFQPKHKKADTHTHTQYW